MIWALYPETSQRTLEEIDALFAADSIWNWEAEKNFQRMKELGAVPERRSSVLNQRRKSSIGTSGSAHDGYVGKEVTQEIESKV